ncbi:MAG: hypothetical protein R3A48_11495 [Polyangiales bacterium]
MATSTQVLVQRMALAGASFRGSVADASPPQRLDAHRDAAVGDMNGDGCRDACDGPSAW